MNKVLAICAIFFLFYCRSGLAQQKVIPVAPEAAALAKSINFPVGYDTGVPDISVPLYEIKSGSLSLPISIRYHAGGYKVGELPTNVGMGWSLSTDLQITRTVNGKDDFHISTYAPNNGYYYNTTGPHYAPGPLASYNTAITTAEQVGVSKGEMDQEPDHFNFKLLNKSGTFYFQKYLGGTVKAVTIPYSQIEIKWLGSNKFEIRDTDGTLYKFGNTYTEQTQVVSGGSLISSPVTSWKCYEIIAPNKKDVISFTYTSGEIVTTNKFSETIELYENQICSGSQIYAPNVPSWILTYADLSSTYPTAYQLATPRFFTNTAAESFDANPAFRGFFMAWEGVDGSGYREPKYKKFTAPATFNTTYVFELALQEITFKGGKAVFSGTVPELSTISIKNDRLEEIRKISFVQSATGGTRYLDELKIGSGSDVEKYTFGYLGKVAYTSMLRGSDAWGYRNGSTGTGSTGVSVPSQNVTTDTYYSEYGTPACITNGDFTFGIGQGSKDPNYSSVALGVLNKITYPGGGCTTFAYQLNQYKDEDDNILDAGGLRIASIKYYEGAATGTPAFEKSYKYGESEDGGGVLKFQQKLLENYAHHQKVKYVYVDALGNIGTPSVIEDKTTFGANAFADVTYSSGSPVRYHEVAEYQKNNGVNAGKTVYYYDKSNNGFNPVYTRDWDDGGVSKKTDMIVKLSDWHIGTLDSAVTFKYTTSGYEWIKKNIYTYTKYELDEQVRVGLVYQKDLYVPTAGSYPIYDSSYTGSEFETLVYGKSVGLMQLTDESEHWNDGNAELVKSTHYDYAPAHLMPRQVTTSVSGGKSTATYTTYPQDYATATDFVKNLVDNYMISMPIEKITMVKEGSTEQVVSGEITTYRSDNTGLPDKVLAVEIAEPVTRSAFKFSNYPVSGPGPGVYLSDTRYKEKLSFAYDDKNNISAILPKVNLKKSYKWGYNKVFSIAECTNADTTEFYVQNFEDLSGASTGTANTGTRYQSGDYLVSWTRPNSRAYLIDYAYRSSGVWKYMTGVPYTGSSMNLTAGDAIDDVRIYPADAQISSYAYNPLLGVTGMIDVNGRRVTYEYDLLGRLKTIKDYKGNVIKHFCYNYAGQSQPCPIIYPN